MSEYMVIYIFLYIYIDHITLYVQFLWYIYYILFLVRFAVIHILKSVIVPKLYFWPYTRFYVRERRNTRHWSGSFKSTRWKLKPLMQRIVFFQNFIGCTTRRSYTLSVAIGSRFSTKAKGEGTSLSTLTLIGYWRLWTGHGSSRWFRIGSWFKSGSKGQSAAARNVYKPSQSHNGEYVKD